MCNPAVINANIIGLKRYMLHTITPLQNCNKTILIIGDDMTLVVTHWRFLQISKKYIQINGQDNSNINSIAKVEYCFTYKTMLCDIAFMYVNH